MKAFDVRLKQAVRENKNNLITMTDEFAEVKLLIETGNGFTSKFQDATKFGIKRKALPKMNPFDEPSFDLLRGRLLSSLRFSAEVTFRYCTSTSQRMQESSFGVEDTQQQIPKSVVDKIEK